MRIFCHTHKRSFLADATTPVVCEKGSHVLGAAPGDKSAHDYWEYCCSCQNFWRINQGEPALPRCPVCEREVSNRFLCSNCDAVTIDSSTPSKSRDFYLSLNGTPVPGCPACLDSSPGPTLEHDCETFEVTFLTSRTMCPFCAEKIGIALSFPASVAAFLEQHAGDRLELSVNPGTGQLVKAEPGDFVLLTTQTSPAQILLPNQTQFSSDDDYFGYYQDYYDCDGPFEGDVVVVHPAIVRKEGRGWTLQEAGRLKVEPRADEIVVEDTEDMDAADVVDDAQEQTGAICSQCGLAGRPHHKFCKRCGARLVPDGEPILAPIITTHGSRTKTVWLAIGAVVLLTLGLLVLPSVIGRNSTENRLKDAIARGNLITPPNESARDLYAKLQRESASVATLASYRDELLPRLVQRPDALLHEITLPRGSDGSLAEWEEAKNLLAWATELSPQDKKLAAKAAYCEGRTAYLKGRYDEAIASYERATKLDPEWPTAFNSLGGVLNERRRFVESRRYLNEAIRRNPNWALPYNNLGTSYFYENRTYEATINYEKARDLAPTWARPHAWLGSLALKDRDYCKAADELEQALRLATPNMTNWNSEKLQNDLNSARAACAAIPEE